MTTESQYHILTLINIPGTGVPVYPNVILVKEPPKIDTQQFGDGIPAEPCEHECNCDIVTLLKTGCKCGGK